MRHYIRGVTLKRQELTKACAGYLLELLPVLSVGFGDLEQRILGEGVHIFLGYGDGSHVVIKKDHPILLA